MIKFQALVNESRKLFDSISNKRQCDPETWFTLGRGVWSCHQRWGNLEDAIEMGERLEELVDAVEQSQKKLELQLETAHLLAVSYLGHGNLQKCFEAGNRGKLLCEQMPNFNKVVFGNHDGAACCKMMRAIAVAVLQDTGFDPVECAHAAVQYAATQKNATTGVIAQSYFAMLHLFRGEFTLAEDRVADVIDDDPAPWKDVEFERWRVMATLVFHCASVGRRWDTRTEIDDAEKTIVQKSRDRFSPLRERWRSSGKDYDAIWLAFEGAANVILGDLMEGELLLNQGIQSAIDRSEKLFLPELYRLRGIIRRERGKQVEANADFQNAVNEAKGMEAKLFLQHIEAAQTADAPQTDVTAI